jgi:large subunit ribosomal protein L10
MSEKQVKIQPYKAEAVEALKEVFKGKNGYIFADYRGLTVEEITTLRSELRKEGVQFKVVKNRFAKIALKEMDYPDVAEYLVGPTAVALSEDVSGAVAKILLDFAKDAPLEVKGGLIDGNVFDQKQVEAFSKLPSRAQLLGKLMGTMNAPVQNLVYVMNGVTEKLVRTLKAVADSKGE